MHKIFHTLSYHWKATQLLFSHKRLWKYILWPWLIALFIFFIFFVVYIWVCAAYVPRIQQKIPLNEKYRQDLREFLTVKLQVTPQLANEKPVETALQILFAIFAFALAILCQSIINAPFNERLSREVERILTRRLIVGSSPGYWKELWQGFRDKSKEIGLYLLVILFLLPFQLVPILGQIISLVVAFFLTGKAYCGYVFERRKLSFAVQKNKFRHHFLSITVFGAVSFLILITPVVNIFFLPLNVIAASMLCVERWDRRILVRKKSF